MSVDLTEWRNDIVIYVEGCPMPLIDRLILLTVRDFCSYTGIWKTMLSPMDTVVIEEASDIAFVSGSPCTITSTDTDFSTSGLAAGDSFITNHISDDEDEKSNTGPFTIATSGLAANTLTLASTDRLVSVDAGTAVTISKYEYALTSSLGDICKVEKVRFNGETLTPAIEDWLNIHDPQWQINLTPQPTMYIVDMARKYLRLVYAPYEALDNVIEVWTTLKPTTTATSVQDFIYNEYREPIAYGVISRLCLIPNNPWSNEKMGQYYNALFLKGRNKAWVDANKGITKANFTIMA